MDDLARWDLHPVALEQPDRVVPQRATSRPNHRPSWPGLPRGTAWEPQGGSIWDATPAHSPTHAGLDACEVILEICQGTGRGERPRLVPPNLISDSAQDTNLRPSDYQ
jgi:hypothetical protein